MSICESCQNVCVRFYFFWMKARKSQESFCLRKPANESQEIRTDPEEPVVMHTIDIVEGFIKNEAVQIFIEDETESRLIIERVHRKIKKLMQQEEDSNADNLYEPFEDSYFNNEEEFEKYEECTVDDASKVIEKSDDSFREEAVDDTSVIVEKSIREDAAEYESFTTKNVEFVERTPEYMLNANKPSRRHKNPDNWIRNRVKTARAKGKEYTTHSGKVIPAKRMQSPCKENCRMKCSSKVSESDRQSNFDNYWALGSFILQRKFLYEHHKAVPVQRRRFRKGEVGKGREYSSHYYLDRSTRNGSTEQVHVCEKMFLKTFDICRNIVSYLHKKAQTGKVQDLRGITKRKLSAGHEAAIAQIKAYPFYHLETPMPLSKMFQLYQQECLEKEIEAVKNHTYRKLFAEYNESEFLKRDKSFCEICDEYEQSSEDIKKLLEENFLNHLNDNEKCLQKSKRIQTSQNSDQEAQLDDTDDYIIEEHLSDEEIE